LSVEASGDGARVAVGGLAWLTVFDAASGALVRRLDTGAMAPGGAAAAVAAGDALAFVDVGSGAVRARIPKADDGTLVIDPAGTVRAAGAAEEREPTDDVALVAA